VFVFEAHQKIGQSAIGRIARPKHKTGHRDATRPEDATREADRPGSSRFNGISHMQVAESIVNLHGRILTQRAGLDQGIICEVCVRCNSEEELMAIQNKALEMGLEVHLITDSGRTEFHGQPTRTCLAIGPDDAWKIDQVTGQLELL
jgi:peptidyl-tRNA hydrolase